MKLTVLGSSSLGNCYLLHNERECLIIEAGIKFLEVKKALNFKISQIVGLLVSHEHGDHAAFLHEYVKAGIPICASKGTLSSRNIGTNNLKPTLAEKTVKFGGFRVMAFDTIHDSAEPFGFLINHDEMGTCLFATDTADLDYEFSGLNNLLIEANYSDEIVYERIYNGKLNAKQQERTVKSHMSLESCEKFLKSNDLTSVNNIVLIHLSDGNSNSEQFRNRIGKATGKTVLIAEKNMSINFNKAPF